VQNAQESADRLAQAGGAYRVSSTELLTREIIRLAADPVARSIAGHHARQVVIDNRGVAARTLELLAAIAAGR